ncbi:hypothetical protein RJ639_025889 [Escallonia herrerae]|uniref:Uncharacterized protein n=1 Tax=Escallonia herrerae TaxID=1293975 RepID=A0AA88UXA0_9ASTE|nr:hypothetical protein RJ639_025889 [Escallonia herrerae]
MGLAKEVVVLFGWMRGERSEGLVSVSGSVGASAILGVGRYAQDKLSDEAISLSYVMKEGGQDPDKLHWLECCVHGVNAYASQKGIKHDIYFGTALGDKYAKCGSVDYPFRVSQNIAMKDELSWNAMISGFAFLE